MKNKLLYLLLLAILLIAAYFYFSRSGGSEKSSLITRQVSSGLFEIYVNATGELKAKKSVKIRGPQGMRSVGIWQTNITQLIPEGTVVKKGDFVASLDKSEIATKISEVQSEIEKIQTQLEQAKIDTTIEMKEIRDQIANLEFSMEQERLQIEKNRFEPQMIIEESRLKLEKSERDYAQLQDKLRLKKIQTAAKIGEIDANLKQQTNRLQQYLTVANDFTVHAPEDGMLIYEQSWNGKKGPGSQVSGWDPVVAELPDLSDFISLIFVNEVDISKVKKGQSVKIKIDAFPEKIFEGIVNEVANIGQQLRNQDAKVFEVTVQLNQADSVMRPAMTTSNEILVYSYNDVISVPLEAYQKNDSMEYVVVKDGNTLIKREVVGHVSNNDAIIIAAGLEKDDWVCLTFPDDISIIPMEPLDPEVKNQTLEKLKIVQADRIKKEQENALRVKEEFVQREESSPSGIVIIN